MLCGVDNQLYVLDLNNNLAVTDTLQIFTKLPPILHAKLVILKVWLEEV